MFMKRKIKSAKGFTLAELLIVVAIIAVLVAIGIPIFTSQLEKSREAVDLSDVRSAYAEVMMAAITGDTTAYYTKDANQTIYKQPGSTPEGNVYSITVEPLKQKQDNWQTALPITIGGVSSTDNVHWVGNPGANGKCRIVYTPAQGSTGDYVTFYWEGGTSGDSGNGGTGKDNNSGGTTDSGNSDIREIVKSYGCIEWPERDKANGVYTNIGQLVFYNGSYYVAAFTGTCPINNQWYITPEDVAYKNNYIKVSGKVYTSKDVENGNVKNSSYGGIYQDGNGNLYIYNATYSGQAIPNGTNSSQWIQIIKNSNLNW